MSHSISIDSRSLTSIDTVEPTHASSRHLNIFYNSIHSHSKFLDVSKYFVTPMTPLQRFNVYDVEKILTTLACEHRHIFFDTVACANIFLTRHSSCLRVVHNTTPLFLLYAHTHTREIFSYVASKNIFVAYRFDKESCYLSDKIL